jgi:hypothetical protein
LESINPGAFIHDAEIIEDEIDDSVGQTNEMEEIDSDD